jgi:HK97 family phage prohead protease
MEVKEYKSFYSPVQVSDIETKDDGSQVRRISGYFAHFGSVDSDGDIFQKGAFSKSIQENGPKSNKNRIKFLFDHDKKQVVGVLDNLYEDEIGLKYEGVLGDWDTGEKVYKMAKMGALTEHSVGFQTKKRHPQNKEIITEAKLWEGSILQAWGANSNTPLVYVKSDESNFTADDLEYFLYKLTKSNDIELKEIYAIQFKEFLKSVEPKEADGITSKDSNPITSEEIKQTILKFYK